MNSAEMTSVRKLYWAKIRKIQQLHQCSASEAQIIYRRNKNGKPTEQQPTSNIAISPVARRLQTARAFVDACGGDMKVAAEFVEMLSLLS